MHTVLGRAIILVTFRLEYEDDHEYEISVLSMRLRFGGRNFSKCACSELKIPTRSRYSCIEVKQIY